MGIATSWSPLCPTYFVHRHLGRSLADGPARPARHRRRRRMGRLGSAGDGMVAHPRPAWLGGILAAIWRAGRTFSGERGGARVQHALGRSIPVWGWRFRSRSRSFWSASACGSASASLKPRCFRKLLESDKIERRRSWKSSGNSPRNHPFGTGADVRTGALLHLHGFHFRLRGQRAEDESRLILAAVMAAAASFSFVTIPLSGHISDQIGRAEDVFDRRGRRRCCSAFSISAWSRPQFRRPVFIAIVLSLIPHDIQYGPQAALIAEMFTPRLRYSGASWATSSSRSLPAAPAPLSPPGCSPPTTPAIRSRSISPACAVISAVATTFMPDYTGKDISRQYDA